MGGPRRGWAPFLLLLLGAVMDLDLGGPLGLPSASHSLLYFRTFFFDSRAGPHLPFYLELGYLDGRPIERYQSSKPGGGSTPLAPWMNRSASTGMEGYWGVQDTLGGISQEAFGHYLLILQRYFNHGRGPGGPDGGSSSCSSSEFECRDGVCVPWHYICDLWHHCRDGSDEEAVLCSPQGSHTLQCIDGCYLGPDGQEKTFHREAFDGQEMSHWEPTWDLYRHRKSFWGRSCSGWLKGHLPFLEEEETKPPEVRVTLLASNMEGSPEGLTCRVDSFYPQEVNVSWTKDSHPVIQGMLRWGVVPNSDGTFQTRLSLPVDSQERGRYQCHVEHAGLMEPLDVAWEGDGSTWPLVWGISGAGAVLLLLLLMTGFACYLTGRPSSASDSASAPESNTQSPHEAPPEEPETFSLVEKNKKGGEAESQPEL